MINHPWGTVLPVAASLFITPLLLAGASPPAEAASSHVLTVHISSRNCPWGYSSVSSVRVALIPSLDGIPGRSGGNKAAFNVPSGQQAATISGTVYCSPDWWNLFGPRVGSREFHALSSFSSSTRNIYV